MVSYRSSELLSSTEVAKRFGSVLQNVVGHRVEKIGVLKNNRVEAVLIATDEYERLKALEEQMEELHDAALVRERRKTPKEEFIPFEQVLEATEK